MSAMNGVGVYAVYQESLQRIANGRGDYRDTVIVSQWRSGTRLTEEKDNLRKEVERLNKVIRTLTYCNDLHDTRESPGVIAPGLQAYLAGTGSKENILN